MVRLLLDKGADVNAQGPTTKVTALHIAMSKDYKDIALLLLDRGADFTMKDNLEKTPIVYVRQRIGEPQRYAPTPEMIKLVDEVEKTAGGTPLHWAAYRGNRGTVSALLKKGIDVNIKSTTRETFTPLHIAVRKGNKKVAALLIAQKANVNEKDKFNDTPLHYATETGQKDMAKMLLDNGANINATGSDGFSPLHSAVSKHNKDMVVFLLEQGADTTIKNRLGRTPLQMAKISPATPSDIVKALKKAEPSILKKLRFKR